MEIFDKNTMFKLYLIVMHDALCYGFIQHLFIPLLQPLGLGYLLVCRVTVEDVIISFTRRASPDVSCGKPKKNKIQKGLIQILRRQK